LGKTTTVGLAEGVEVLEAVNVGKGVRVSVKVGMGVGVRVAVGVGVKVAVADSRVTVAPVSGIPLKNTAWPLLPAAAVTLKA
jgi:hypothetical protein